MVRISFDQKPFRKLMMQVWGANCVASPSNETNAGRTILASMPDTPGSLGIAISEAIEAAVSDGPARPAMPWAACSTTCCFTRPSSASKPRNSSRRRARNFPTWSSVAPGGGSNFAGLAFPFAYDKINGAKIKIIPVEPAACPKMTKGKFVYDHGDMAGMTPLLPMHSLGHTFVPKPIHAGGLRYHGMAPLVCQGVVEGLFEPKAFDQLKATRRPWCGPRPRA